MTQEMKKALATPDVQAAWIRLGAEPPALYGAAFAEFVASETKRWAEVVKAGHIKLD